MEAQRQAEKSITVTIDSGVQLEHGVTNRKNYGYVVFSKIYHWLEIDRLLKNARRHAEPYWV